MKVFLMIDGSVVFEGEWEKQGQATATLLTAVELLHNLGVKQGSKVIRQMDDCARADIRRREVG